ncbi:MAG TPA: hypothetical protein VGN42_10850, partial [Pirellulales bacterium]|nr:hypothetical protein [Pirellulales bacterium]
MTRENPKPDESGRPEPRHRPADDQVEKAVDAPKKTGAGAASVTTGDAEALSPLGFRQDRPPESAYSFETSPANPASIDTGPGRDVVEREPSRSPQNPPEKNPSDEKASAASDRGEPKAGKAPGPSMMSGWKGLVIVAVVALVCGAASAWAYTELLGSSKSHDRSSAGEKESGGGKKGGSESNSSKSGGKQASN